MDPLNFNQEVAPEELDEFIDKLATAIVDRHLAAPAIVVLESSKPLTFVGSQMLVFFDPIIRLVGGIKDYNKFYKVLEDRNNIEKLIQAIERIDDEKSRKKR